MQDAVISHLNHNELMSCVEKCIHKGSSFAQPSIFLFHQNGKAFAYKTFSQKFSLARLLWGAVSLKKEFKVLKKLLPVSGVPKVYYFVSNFGYVMEYLEAERIPRRRFVSSAAQPEREKIIEISSEEKSNLSPEFFDKAMNILIEIHKRGVAHCDIRRNNILVGRGETPIFIDFATAFVRNEGSNFIRQKIFNYLCKVDRITLVKIKASYFPGSITKDEKILISSVPFYLRFGRFLRQKIYRPLKKIFKKRK